MISLSNPLVNLPLRTRILGAITLLLLLTTGTSQWLETRELMREYRAELNQVAARSTTRVQQEAQASIANAESGRLLATMQREAQANPAAHLVWQDRSGRRLRSLDQPIRLIAPHWFLSLFSIGSVTRSLPVFSPDRYLGTLTATFEDTPWENRLWQSCRRQMVEAAMQLLLSLGLMTLLLRANLRALDTVAETARRFLVGNYSARARIPATAAPELRRVVETLNAAGDGIEILLLSLSEQRRATDNAALVVEANLQGLVIYVNDLLCEVTGFGRGDLIGDARQFLDASIHPPLLLDEIWTTISSGQVWRGELQYRKRDGSLFWVDTTITPILNAQGRPEKFVSVRFDITARKAAQDKLHEQLNLMQGLMEAIPSPVYFIDTEHRYVGVNRAWEASFAAPGAGVAGKTVQELFPESPEAAAFHRQMDVALLDRGGTQSYEIQMVDRSGQRLHLMFRKATYRDADGKVAGLIGVANDITELRTRELELARITTAVDGAGDAIAICAGNGHPLFVNRAFSRLFGYTMKELEAVGCPAKLVREPALQDEILVALADGRSWAGEPEIKIHNGLVLPTALRANAIRGGEGSVIGQIFVFADIAARKRAEDILRESEARYRGITSNVPGMVFQLVRHANGLLQFTYVSEWVESLTSVSAEEVTTEASSLLRRIVIADWESFLSSMQISAASLEAWNWEGRLEDVHDVKWINLRATPRQSPDGSTIWDGVALNITDSRRSQEELLQSREALRALAAHLQTAREDEKAHIAREIHDELGGTLTALKMDNFWVARRLPRGDVALAEKVDAMGRLIDGAVQTTRRISTELRPTVLDDLGLVAAIEWQVNEFRNRMGVDCVFSAEPPTVELDEKRAIALFRILQECLTNIARHAQATRVETRLTATEREISLEVRDNGCGMDESRVSNPLSHGLRGILERTHHLGGTASVSSQPGRGTTISVALPAGC